MEVVVAAVAVLSILIFSGGVGGLALYFCLLRQ
jgi:hypothetical protein